MTDIKGKGKEVDPSLPVPPGPSAASTSGSRTVVQDDDDDLDDLDDVLDQFKAAPVQTKASSSVTPGTADAYDRAMQADKGTSNGQADGAGDQDEDDEDDFEAVFAAELAKEMEKMMGAMKQQQPGDGGSSSSQKAGSAGATGLDALSAEDQAILDDDKELKDAIERIMASAKDGNMGAPGEDDFNLEELTKLMSSLGGGAGTGGEDLLASLGQTKPSTTSTTKSKTASSAAPPKPAKPQTFEDTLKATMSRLADSEAGHKTRANKSGKDSNDPLAALMAQMEALGGMPGMGGKDGDDENLPQLLDGLMDQLMSKELLHEPITELRQKYPEYLKSGEAASLPAEERSRYEKQEEIVNKIYAIFEDPKYDDANQETREKVAELMQQMQDCGAPPKHLMGELGPAMGFNADGTPNVDPENCMIC